jgi:hypothetical protein
MDNSKTLATLGTRRRMKINKTQKTQLKKRRKTLPGLTFKEI